MYEIHKNLAGAGYVVRTLRYSGHGYYEPFGAPMIVESLDAYKISEIGREMLENCAVLTKVPAA